MLQAIVEAKVALHKGEIPIGAVIVAGNTIIARGHNLTEQLSDVTAHAEMQAVSAAAIGLGAKYLPDCRIYVTLEPCLMCAGALFWCQIGEVHYSASDPRMGFARLGRPVLHPKTKLFSGLLAEESLSLLKTFFLERRKGV